MRIIQFGCFVLVAAVIGIGVVADLPTWSIATGVIAVVVVQLLLEIRLARQTGVVCGAAGRSEMVACGSGR